MSSCVGPIPPDVKTYLNLFLKRLIPIFKSSFFVPLFGNGLTNFQPVFIDDVSFAIEKIIETLGQNDKNKPSCQAFVKKLNEVKRPTINFMNAC